MWSKEDEKRLDAHTKIELIRMYLKLEEDYADQSHLLDLVTEDLEALQEIAIKYIDERTKMQKEITELKRNK
jgi:hypothetical protein